MPGISAKSLRWALCLTPLLFLQVVQAAEEPAAGDNLLQEMSEAARTLNYRGVMVYARNGEMRSLRIVHRYHQGREQERIQSLNGEPREILRDEDVVTCILPKDRQVMLDRRELRGVLSSVHQISTGELQPHYRVVAAGDARLIDRACKVFQLEPNDPYRYGYRVWVDQATSLPLRLDLIDRRGHVLEQSMFTQIDFPEQITDEEMQPALDPMQYQWVRHDEVESMPIQGESQWRIDGLPPGFKLIERGMRTSAKSSTPVEHMLFSDGLATVSVMMRPQRDQRLRFVGLSKMGAVHVYARQVGGQHVTVMGEVPRATVEYIGRKLHWQATEPNPAASPQAEILEVTAEE